MRSSELLGWMVILILFITITSLMWVVNEYWKYNIIPKYINDWGFWVFTVLTLFFLSLIIVASIIRFIAVFAGGLFGIGFGQISESSRTGSATLNLPGSSLITFIMSLFVFAALLPLSVFMISNLPFVGYSSVVVLMAGSAMQQVIKNI